MEGMDIAIAGSARLWDALFFFTCRALSFILTQNKLSSFLSGCFWKGCWIINSYFRCTCQRERNTEETVIKKRFKFLREFCYEQWKGTAVKSNWCLTIMGDVSFPVGSNEIWFAELQLMHRPEILLSLWTWVLFSSIASVSYVQRPWRGLERETRETVHWGLAEQKKSKCSKIWKCNNEPQLSMCSISVLLQLIIYCPNVLD